MDTTWALPSNVAIIAIAAIAATVSAALTASACRWWFSRSIALLQSRLHHSELGRQAAHERAQSSRQQVEHLNKVVADLQKRQTLSAELHQRRAKLQASFAANREDAPSQPAQGFADTLPMQPGT